MSPFCLSVHHATHLAGIIASQNSFGFMGLWPKVHIKPFIWEKYEPNGLALLPTPDRDSMLASLMRWTSKQGQPLPIYLAAISYNREGEVRYVDGHYKTPSQRFLTPLESEIKNSRPLLIVAAGQGEKPSETIDLSVTSPELPQNLGDLENVIVVSACTECRRDQQELMPTTWYSSRDRIVHVAAPGGNAIPGWISEDSIGSANGTSQAAAYVAGVAASMISAFSSSYREPVQVKLRLQVTSYPIVTQSDVTSISDADKIATGIVDPVLARLDPSKDWIKVGQEWRAVQIKRFSSDRMDVTGADGKSDSITMSTVLRMVQSQGMGRRRWSIYTDLSQKSKGRSGEVGKIDFTTATPMTISFCDGTSRSLSNIEDLIISLGGIRDDQCTAP